ncbi:MAG: hypothetical protein K6B52_05065 [Clostridiales bacterium]|nr:hypothetical protein [Clostridiales bacterium]
MLLEYFERYLRIKSISENSIGKYVRGIARINKYLEDYNFPIKNVFEAHSVDEINLIRDFLKTNEEFVNQDTRGNRMYSVGFNHFYRFATKYALFFQANIEKMDVVVTKPEIVSTTNNVWKRNRIIVAQALEGADYCCEHNHEHHTFISQSTGREYMEGHHLIPLRFQKEFENSIDVYANIVCLCPVCHRMMHSGIKSNRKYAAEKIYYERNHRFIKSGIDLSKRDFLKMAVSL